MTFDEFWMAYLSQHRKPGTRLCHYFGTVIGLLGGFVLAVVGQFSFALVVAVAGYSLAIAGHFIVERNKPYATKPLWGFVADLRMLKRAITGELASDLARLDDMSLPGSS